jgi:hypothetical protein
MPLHWQEDTPDLWIALGTYRREPVSACIKRSWFGLHVSVVGRRYIGGNRVGETLKQAQKRAWFYARYATGRRK